MRAPDYPVGVPPRILDDLREVTLRPDAVDQGFDALAVRAPSVAHDPAFRAWHDRAGNRGASPATARVFGDVFNHADVRALLPRITVPTLVIHRRENQWTRVGHGRYLAEHIPGATYVELPGADDMYWVGDSHEILDEIEEFMTGRRTAPEGDVTLAAVLFTDIVASTEQSARLGHRKWAALMDAHDRMIDATMERYRGRVVKTHRRRDPRDIRCHHTRRPSRGRDRDPGKEHSASTCAQGSTPVRSRSDLTTCSV